MTGLRGFAYGLPAGLASYALASHVLLLLGAVLPTFLFPACLLLGGLAGAAFATRRARPPATPGPDVLPAWFARILPYVTVAVVLAAVAIVTYGAVSSTDRSWDGLVAWSLRAKYLVPPTGIDKPIFHDLGIYGAGLSYPPLQPLCQGAMLGLFGEHWGRVFFPLLYVGAIAIVAIALIDAGRHPGEAALATLAFTLTPMWLNTGAGAVDSGYADLFLSYTIAIAATGILHRNLVLLGIGAMLIPMVKPEGAAYGLALCAATGLCGPKRVHAVACSGFAAGLLLWLPLRSGTGVLASCLGPLALLIGLLLFAKLARRVQPFTLALVAGVAALVGVAAVFTFEDALRQSEHLILRDFVVNILDIGERIKTAPRLLRGYADALFALNQVGLGLVVILFLLLAPRSLVGPNPCSPLTAFLVFGLVIACLAMLLAPNPDLDHDFEARFDRLMLHWVGIGWILAGAWVFGDDEGERAAPPARLG